MRNVLLTMAILLSPVEPVVGRVSLSMEVVTASVVLFDSDGDGIRDDWRGNCVISIDVDTDILTAVCPSLED